MEVQVNVMTCPCLNNRRLHQQLHGPLDQLLVALWDLVAEPEGQIKLALCLAGEKVEVHPSQASLTEKVSALPCSTRRSCVVFVCCSFVVVALMLLLLLCGASVLLL